MTAEPLAAICTETRMSAQGRVWVCVLDDGHEVGKHYMICTD